jgi:hypothetical protein
MEPRSARYWLRSLAPPVFPPLLGPEVDLGADAEHDEDRADGRCARQRGDHPNTNDHPEDFSIWTFTAGPRAAP